MSQSPINTEGQKTKKLVPPSRWRIRTALAMERLRFFRFDPSEALSILWTFDEWLTARELTFEGLQESVMVRGSQWAREFIRGWYIAITMAITIVGILTAFLVANTYTGPAPIINTGPGPVVQAPSGFERPAPLSGYNYLSVDEAASLRQDTNVVHAAVLGEGFGARYMRDYAASREHLKDKWTLVNDRLVVQQYSLDSTGTHVVVKFDNQEFNLNVGQGFISAKEGKTLFIVDRDGQLWSIPLNLEPFIGLDEAKALLKDSIPANPDLTFTYHT